MMIDRYVYTPIGALLLLSCNPSAATTSAAQYRAVDLGDLPGGDNGSEALGLNDHGQVVGFSFSAAGQRPFLWDAVNGMRDLGDLPGGGDGGFATAINNVGQVVGSSGAGTGGHPFIWDAVNGMQDLGILPIQPGGFDNGRGTAINDSGQVAGYSGGSNRWHPFLWTAADGVTDLGDVPGGENQCYAFDINALGQVLGTGQRPGIGPIPFLWTAADGLQPLPAELKGAVAINDPGEIAGYDNIANHAFIWSSTDGYRDLGELPGGGDGSFASAINNSGQVVGSSLVKSLSDVEPFAGYSGFVWDRVHGMRDLNSLVDASADGWRFVYAYGNNNAGQIICNAVKQTPTGDYVLHGFLLTPIPEPASYVLAAMALVVIRSARRPSEESVTGGLSRGRDGG